MMTDDQFTRALLGEVVHANTRLYAELFGAVTPALAADPYWQAAAALYADLRPEQRQVFLAILQQVSVDAVASVLAVLDGIATLPGQAAPLELRHGDQVLSGALADHFLAQVAAPAADPA